MDLSNNNLRRKTGAELAQAFAELPTNVTTLDLSRNNLADKTGAELAQAFAALPANVTTLNLSRNNLADKTGAELTQAFAALPTNVTTLNLSGNGFGYKTSAELAQAFAALPKSVTALDLSSNDLWKKTGEELAQALAALPTNVTALDLSWNGLGNKTGTELAKAFAAIPKSVTALDLSSNDLRKKTGAELAKAFAAIPKSVTALDLSSNDLRKKTGAELAQALAALPTNMTTLDLSSNLLGDITDGKLAIILTNLAFAISKINIGEVHFENLSQACLFFKNIPQTISSLTMNGATYTPPSRYLFSFVPEAELETLVKNYTTFIEDEENNTYFFYTFEPGIEINNELLFTLLEIAINHPHPKTDLICALLLDGRIIHRANQSSLMRLLTAINTNMNNLRKTLGTILELGFALLMKDDIENIFSIFLENCNDEFFYIIQSKALAIDFFRRAACTADKKLSSSIEEIVSHIKAIEPRNSLVFKKLSQLTFSQEAGFAESFKKLEPFINSPDKLPAINMENLKNKTKKRPCLFSESSDSTENQNPELLKKI